MGTGFQQQIETDKLYREKLASFSFLSGEQRQSAEAFFLKMRDRNELSKLISLFDALNQGKTEWSYQNLSYSLHDQEHVLRNEHFTLTLSAEEIKKIIQSAFDMLGPCLPMGSVVELKKEQFKKIVASDKIQHARIVVTHRFLFHPDLPVFFPYAGTVYPVGTTGTQAVLHFTAPFIETVLHQGFSDEEENAFVYLMKRELLLEKDKHSITFATSEERKAYQNKMKELNPIGRH